MGVQHNVFVGPFAEFLVRPEAPPPHVSDVAEGKLLAAWGFSRAWGLSDPPTVAIDGVLYRRYCFVPRDRRPGQPQRPMDYSELGEGSGVEDLRGVDAHAEMDWLARAFREELRALEKFCGCPARLGWGVVAWLS